MKPTSEILERIEKCSTEHQDGVFTKLYRYLLREDIYYAAYQKLYANRGATTKGIDNDTADGFSDRYVKDLIQQLREGKYSANPVRRKYIPKKNGQRGNRKVPHKTTIGACSVPASALLIGHSIFGFGWLTQSNIL